MSSLDVDWAITQLRSFIYATDIVKFDIQPQSVVRQRATDLKAAELAYVAEQVLDRVLPEWRADANRDTRSNARWTPLREWAARGIAALERGVVLREKLGDSAPHLSAGNFHPWIWGGASSLWQSGHYREAVEGAIRMLNAKTQNKVGRRDVSEADLFNQAFSEQPASEKNPRLHRMSDDGSKTFKSVQRGARMFAEGVFAGIRNPLAHEAEQEMPEQQALEYLAALSVLARWVDKSTLRSS